MARNNEPKIESKKFQPSGVSQVSEKVLRGTELAQKLSSELGLLALETQRLWNQIKAMAPHPSTAIAQDSTPMKSPEKAPQRKLEESIEHSSDRFWREAEGIRQEAKPFGVFLVRIDRLDQLQHDHGTQIANAIFKKLTERLSIVSTNPAKMGRWSPSEIAVAVRGSQPELVAYAEQIRRSAEKLYGKSDAENVYWRCTVSVGVAIDAAEVPSPESEIVVHDALNRPSLARLIRSAEKALKDALERGSNQVRLAA